MDARFILQGIIFVWDEEKARRNPLQHKGISFEQGAETFFDPFLKVVDASRRSETREAIIGMDMDWKLLFVVFMEWEGESIRIISARKATQKERKIYEA